MVHDVFVKVDKFPPKTEPFEICECFYKCQKVILTLVIIIFVVVDTLMKKGIIMLVMSTTRNKITVAEKITIPPFGFSSLYRNQTFR